MTALLQWLWGNKWPHHIGPSGNTAYMSRQQINKNDMCTQRRLRSAWASAQSDQFSLPSIQFFIFQSHRNLSSLATHWVHSGLIRLCGYPCWSDFSLGAQSFCWFWHALAQLWQKPFKSAGRLPSNLLAQWLSYQSVRGVVGSIPGRVIPKTFKMVLAALSFALGIEKAELVGPVSI